MSTWETVNHELYESAQISKELTAVDKASLKQGLLNLAETYNIPGISKSQSIGLESPDRNGFAVVSNVGGNITSLEMNGESVYSFGSDPFVVPILQKDQTGYYWNISTPAYYRHLNYTGSPAVNQFDTNNSELSDLPKGFDTGHHGVAACLISDLTVENGFVSHTTIHNPDRTNLSTYIRKTTSGFDANGKFVETLEFTNPNKHSIPFSALRHPYFYMSQEDMSKGEIQIIDNTGKSKTIYKLKDYRNRGEDSLPLPTQDEGKYVRLVKANGTRVNIAFQGDYNPSDSVLQIFSNGPLTEMLVGDFESKYEIYRNRLARLADIQDTIGINTAWYDDITRNLQDIENFSLISDIMKDSGMAAVCIEDGIASKNNIYQNTFNLQTARVLQSNQTVRFTRTTWVD